MTLQPIVLIVDDEKHTRDGLRRLLENDYDVYVTADIAGAMDVLKREQVDVLLTDLRLGSEDGMILIDRALKIPRPPICIMMTAYGSVDLAVEAMKRGAPAVIGASFTGRVRRRRRLPRATHARSHPG
jgi:DNA-binding NtrC family response regulator